MTTTAATGSAALADRWLELTAGYGVSTQLGAGPPGFIVRGSQSNVRHTGEQMVMLGQSAAGQAMKGRADAADAPAYLRMGSAVILYAVAAIGWIGYETSQAEQNAGDFFKALWDARVGLTPWAQTPYDWALIAAALVVGGLALGRRRVARGALMLLAVVLLGLSLRELVGLAVSEEYREIFDHVDYGTWLVVFRVAGLIVGGAVLVEMARAGRRPGHQSGAQPFTNAPGGGGYGMPYDAAPGGYGPGGYGPGGFIPPMPVGRPATARPAFVVAGISLVLLAVTTLGWLVYRLTRDSVYLQGGSYEADSNAGDFFRNVVDASYGPSVPFAFHTTVVLLLAPLLVGIFLLRGLAAARGAALTLAFIWLYLDLRGQVPIFADGNFSGYLDSTVGTFALLTPFLTIPLGIVIVVTLLRVPEE